jgi:membrane protein DedA with SNARE-associated domain
LSLHGDVHHYVAQYGYAAVSLGILFEDFGLPVPGESLLITGAIAASQGTLDIWLLLILAWAGAVVGDNIGFAIGHFGGHRLIVRYGSRIGITQPRFDSLTRAFRRHGDWVIVFARFVAIARQLNGLVAGTLDMHWARFLVLNAIGAALWVGFWGLLAHWFGKRIFKILATAAAYKAWLIGLAILAVVLAAGWYFLRRYLRARQGPAQP